jgi:signal transduction histidine kinase
MILLLCLAVIQVCEPKMPVFATKRGVYFAIALKLVIGYLLMYSSGGVESSLYYVILLLPVVSAATALGALGTALVTLICCAAYLSFLLFVDWTRYTIPPDQVKELLLRTLFLPLVAFLIYRLVEEARVQAKKFQAAAEELAGAKNSLREAEAAVRRSERLAALGQLSAGLAHELRNPLGTIRASAEMLRKNLSSENVVAAELAGFIASEVDRINSLVTRFLEFAKPLQLRLQPTDISDVIDRAVEQLKRHAPTSSIAIFKNYSPDIPPFLIDSELVERAVYNLLLNAAQASPPDGAITVKTKPVDGAIEISVIDRGVGIDPAHLEHIFNPFFTTKPEGVGLGLAIVSKIVDQHGGKITVESELGKGSVFRIYLPVERP